jgi:hypothetical protein
MEVHHHPDLHHEKKKFKEYFLECIMIFIAVTLGFFAETIRDGISERHRERDYIVGLINNLRDDTSNLKGLIARNDLEVSGIDSLMKISKEHLTSISVQDSIFYYALQYSFGLHIFQFNDLTLVQLRNAGGYSLIKTNNVADSIALYESKNNSIKIQETHYSNSYLQVMASFKQVFDLTLTDKFFQPYNVTKKIPSDMYVLISKDEEKLNLLYNDYWTFERIVGFYNSMLKEHLEYLNNFILFLKHDYDLE